MSARAARTATRCSARARVAVRPVALRLVALLLVAAGCAGVAPRLAPRPSLRISQLVDAGDAVRRASTRLLVEGLRADAAGDAPRAKGQYERAIAIDPTNPYAYLVYARFELDRRQVAQARRFLDRARSLVEAERDAEPAPGVEAHLVGLRGAIERASSGGTDAGAWLDRARELDPRAWSDGQLDAAELL